MKQRAEYPHVNLGEHTPKPGHERWVEFKQAPDRMAWNKLVQAASHASTGRNAGRPPFQTRTGRVARQERPRPSRNLQWTATGATRAGCDAHPTTIGAEASSAEAGAALQRREEELRTLLARQMASSGQEVHSGDSLLIGGGDSGGCPESPWASSQPIGKPLAHSSISFPSNATAESSNAISLVRQGAYKLVRSTANSTAPHGTIQASSAGSSMTSGGDLPVGETAGAVSHTTGGTAGSSSPDALRRMKQRLAEAMLRRQLMRERGQMGSQPPSLPCSSSKRRRQSSPDSGASALSASAAADLKKRVQSALARTPTAATYVRHSRSLVRVPSRTRRVIVSTTADTGSLDDGFQWPLDSAHGDQQGDRERGRNVCKDGLQDRRYALVMRLGPPAYACLRLPLHASIYLRRGASPCLCTPLPATTRLCLPPFASGSARHSALS